MVACMLNYFELVLITIHQVWQMGNSVNCAEDAEEPNVLPLG